MVLADGFSCRTQIHELDSGGREAVHLAELLNRARRGPVKPAGTDLADGDRPRRPGALARTAALATVARGRRSSAGGRRAGARSRRSEVTVTEPVLERLTTAVYTFPTPGPEADGTLEWNATTAVTVQLEAGGCRGLGWTYSSPAAAEIVRGHLAGAVHERNAVDIAAGWAGHAPCRAQPRHPWPLPAGDERRRHRLVGPEGAVARRAADPAAGSMPRQRARSTAPGGFTTLDESELADQVQWWRSAGCTAMKIKIGESWGTNVERDVQRVGRLRQLAGDGVELMVDANGGYTVGQALRVGAELDELGVRWFEEPVSSDDVDGLGQLRDGCAAT